jgi:hypothetical protein
VHIQVGTFIRVLTVDNIRSCLGDEGNQAAGDSVAADAGPAALASAKWRFTIPAGGLAATTPMTFLGPFCQFEAVERQASFHLCPLRLCHRLNLANRLALHNPR